MPTEPLIIRLINNTTVHITAPSGLRQACGIFSQEDLSIIADSGATLNLTIWTLGGPSPSTCYAVYAAKNLTITGGSITALSEDKPVNAVFATTNITINNSNITTNSMAANYAVKCNNGSFILNGCHILSPIGGFWDSATYGVVDNSGIAADAVVIGPPIYDFTLNPATDYTFATATALPNALT